MQFFKDWKKNASEYRALQRELQLVMNKRGVNFMHLHPEITKCLIRISRTDGAEAAADWLENTMEIQLYLNRSEKEVSEQLIRLCRKWNRDASR